MLRRIHANLPQIFILTTLLFGLYFSTQNSPITGAPPYGESLEEAYEVGSPSWVKKWTRPEGPARVGLQIGHLENDKLPEELSKLIGNTGSHGGGKTEIEVNESIALGVKEFLEPIGIVVDILPATIPPDYWADVFLAIHADGNLDSSKNGYKIAAPWRDLTGNASLLVDTLSRHYEETTKMQFDSNITRNMRGYYAFGWWRYEHSIHPMTTAAIVETGFLTSPKDRKILVANPQISSQAIANGVVEYLKGKNLLEINSL